MSTEPLRCAGALIVDRDGRHVGYDGLLRRIAEEGFALRRSMGR
ncbi:hypothetical protein [Micromonospora sp. CA-246542]